MARFLVRGAKESGLPLYLLVAVAQRESSFNPLAVNRASRDYGLFQVHYPFWKRFFRKRVDGTLRRVGVEDLMRVPVNVRVGSMILAYDLRLSGGDMVEMLGRYSGRTGRSHERYVAGVLESSMEFVRFRDGQCGR